MYELEEIYSKKTYDEWFKTYPSDLRPTKVKPDIAKQEIWKVLSFKELFKCVTFLATMNKRLVLYYRGQPENWDLLPTLFRDNWKCFDSDRISINSKNRQEYWNKH